MRNPHALLAPSKGGASQPTVGHGRGQAHEDTGLPLAMPSHQERGAKALAAQQCADGTGWGHGSVSLRQGAQFVVGSNRSVLALGENLRAELQ